ncbi:23S rRNA pseudouridine(955/2504/2580) synthase [Saliniradius amylolyticus]|uniref:Pseudouridine synthase n=1 Tax=Saliniradius amylolyticus TaxID=2183582 RepID=A0A2S2E3D6_9ALTE|nr:23S rRNA pseudouridine(955/2504/2580) synthase RluC [Saliniradius amylolyticus]AWL12032.1 23S rRNA pseudouridine(955/2504/2580) synthase [Saliniradius amylolyticus]
MTDSSFSKVQFIKVTEAADGQRIDNFLRTLVKGVPKSLIYRILRKGEVRVNKKRVKPDYKLCQDDEVRVPPVKVPERPELPSANLEVVSNLKHQILYEDETLLVVNKPSGMAVHAGSGVSFGVIEALRSLRPSQTFLELVHRLDRDTSGCLLVAKDRPTLKSLHRQLTEKQVDKRYQALVEGQWPDARHKVRAPLRKNTLKSGERLVAVTADGKDSETEYQVLERFDGATLVEAFPVTGRTHQIRVHCQHAGHPIGGDPKYGSDSFNVRCQEWGLQRLFLHAHSISFLHPKRETTLRCEAPLEASLQRVLEECRRS